MSAPRDNLPAPAVEPATPKRQYRGRWGLRLLAATAAAAVAAPVVLWHSEAATAWVLGHVPGLEVAGWQGSLGAGQLQAQRLHWVSAAGTLEITNLQAQGLDWTVQAGPGPALALSLPTLKLGRLQWQSSSKPQPTSPAPADLHLPLRLALGKLDIGTLQWDGLPALHDVQATLDLGADAGQTHRLEQLRLRTDRFSAEASAQLGANGPLPLQATLALSSLPGGPVWQAQAAAQGPLARFDATATLQGQAPTGAAKGTAPALQAQAQLRPFETWPVGDLTLRSQALDLSTLLASAPRTRLEAEVQLRTAGLDKAAQAQIKLSNTDAGRWDQGMLPVRALQVTVRGPPSPLNRLSGTDLILELGDRHTVAGRIQGSAQWQAAGATQALSDTRLTLSLKDVSPALLDQRAPAMTLSGPLSLSLQAPAEGAAADPAPTWAWQLDSRLSGRLAGPAQAAQAVDVVLLAQGQGSSIKIERATLKSGGAVAEAKGDLSNLGETWRWQAEAKLRDFDPAVWWPGAPDSTWRRGPHRLQALLSTDGQASLAALSQPEQLWRSGSARLALTLEPSVLAGVSLQGLFKLSPATNGAGKAQGSEGLLQLSSGPNKASLQGGSAEGQNLRLALNWPDIAGLAPLLKLHPASASWAPSAGEAEITLDALPDAAQAWAWRLEAKLKALRTPVLSLGSAQLSGQGQSGRDGKAEVRLSAENLQGQPWQVDHLQAELSGSLSQHRLSLSAHSPARPPAWFEQILGAKTGGGSQLSASLQGQWQPPPPTKGSAAVGSAGRWTGQILSLQGRSTDAASQPWLSADNLGLSLDLAASGRPQTAEVQAGRVALPGTAIRWAQNRWRWTEQGELRGQLNAEIEPFAVAPLLARAQPELGWQGDLILGAEIKVQREQQFDADIVFERRSGDLSVASDGLGTAPRQQALGLTDLRLGLAAHNGVWHFTQGLAGQKLGEMAGVATVRTRPELAWPPADAPLDGVWQMRVAELGAWGTWVPPGWRMGGELRSAASLGGRFGAPELTGQISGQGLTLRNVLEGVHLRDGDVDIRLQGSTAQIERFSFKGGPGSVRVSGSASLGAEPKAQLKLVLEQFQALGRIDRKLVASGEAQVELDRDSAKVTGDLRVDEGLVDVSQESAAQLPDDVTVVGAQSPEAARGSAAAPRRKLGLTLKVDLGEKLRLKGRGIDTLLRGDLKLVTSAAGVLSVAGAVRAEQGTYAAYGQKLKIERGVLRFVGPVDDPRLDIFAVRPNIDVVVGVAVTGSALNPRIRLASEPDMPETTKLSWLVLGREPDGLGQADTALLQRAAIALLAGEGEAPTDAMLGAIGLTDFSVRQTGTGEARDTVVALGKQISQRWWIGYERSINTTTGTWQVIYRAAQRFTLRAQSGEDQALDLIWTWRWNPTPPKK